MPLARALNWIDAPWLVSRPEVRRMADEPNRSIWESIRLWLTAVGIPIVLAAAGFWQFYLKEVWWPAAAINLTTEVTIKQVGFSVRSKAETKNLAAIELVITARNPSSSTIYLCSNYWIAWGITVSEPKQQKGNDWIDRMTTIINSDSEEITGKHYEVDEVIAIAGGQAFGDTALRPNEKISATYVFYIPQDRYDLLEVKAMVPTTSKESPAKRLMPAIKINYTWDAGASGYTIASYARVTPSGAEEKLPMTADGRPLERDIVRYNYQEASSVADMSLWRSDKLPPGAR